MYVNKIIARVNHTELEPHRQLRFRKSLATLKRREVSKEAAPFSIRYRKNCSKRCVSREVSRRRERRGKPREEGFLETTKTSNEIRV